MDDAAHGHPPRVLVVSAAPMNGRGGTGITLANLFSSLPPTKVSQLFLDPGSVDPHRCGSILLLANKGSPIDAVIRSHLTRSSPAWDTEPRIAAATPQHGRRDRARAWTSALLDLAPVHLTPSTLRWVADQRPDVIYSPLGSVRVMRIVSRLAQLLEVPVIPHFLDDWPHTLFDQNELGGIARAKLGQQLREVIRLSPILLGISAPMADEYAEMFCRPVRPFMNCVADETISVASVAEPAPVRDLTYVGGLHLERWQSLVGLSKTLSKIAPNVRLRVHAPDEHLRKYRECIANQDNVVWGPSLEPARVPQVLADADVVVHVESWSPEMRKFTRLSISTKLPQYLASGRPILAIGPPDLASMRYLHETGTGMVLRDSDAAGLWSLLSDAPARREMAQRGLDRAKNHHSQSTVSRAFVETLAEAVSGAPA